MNQRFVWLMRREWMQHRLGWVLMAAVPLLLVLLVVPVADVSVNASLNPPSRAALALLLYLWIASVGVAVSVVFQAGGTARRDRQDRSIEFWTSLPVGHVQSVGATTLMHLLVVPLAVVLLSAVAAQLVAAAVMLRMYTAAEAWEVMGGAGWWRYSAAVMLRMGVGTIFAVAWASPLLLGFMAASVWLKRWGVPAVALVVFLGGWLMAKLTGFSGLLDAVSHALRQAARALMPLMDMPKVEPPIAAAQASGMAPFERWMLDGTLQVLRDAATPGFALALAIAAAAFALLVWRRMR